MNMPKKKSKKFRPVRTPRYLIYAVPKSVWSVDLQTYNKHLLAVHNAKCKIDARPPVMNPHDYVCKQKLFIESRRLQDIDMENRQLLRAINHINRTKGRVDSFNPAAYTDRTKWRGHYLRMLEIDRENQAIEKRLCHVKSLYSREALEKDWKKALETFANSAKFPLLVLQQKTLDEKLRGHASISESLHLVTNVRRPKCFMDFKVKDGVYLGRIVMELYVEYVPVTVQNFLAICRGENGLSYLNCPVHRVVRGKYLETGDITNGNGKGGMSVYGKTFAEENFVLKHSKCGVVSMMRVGLNENNSQFSITFDRMDSLDGKRVVFGKVVWGNETVCKINDLGKKAPSSPSVPIIIVNCGEFIKGHVPPIPRYKYSLY